MGNTRGALVVCCEDRSLKTLLRGAAGDSCLEFYPVCQIEGARHLLLASSSAILVLGVSSVSEEHLVAIHQVQSQFGVPVIVVVEGPHEVDAAEVIRAGAIACLGYQDAMRSLAFLVANITSQMLSGGSAIPRAWRPLRIVRTRFCHPIMFPAVS